MEDAVIRAPKVLDTVLAVVRDLRLTVTRALDESALADAPAPLDL